MGALRNLFLLSILIALRLSNTQRLSSYCQEWVVDGVMHTELLINSIQDHKKLEAFIDIQHFNATMEKLKRACPEEFELSHSHLLLSDDLNCMNFLELLKTEYDELQMKMNEDFGAKLSIIRSCSGLIPYLEERCLPDLGQNS
jgi:hypothetical protein